MEKNPVKYALLFGCCVVSLSLWNYLSGRFGFHYSILLFLPIGIALLGTTLFTAGSVVFGSLGYVSEGRFMTAILAILLFGTFGGFPFLMHLDPYLLGVRQQISSRMTPDQIRQAAREALAGSKDGALSRFGLLRSTMSGPYGVVVWLGGCAVCGHTGLQVQEPMITNRYSKGGHLSIAPDIEVFYDPR